MTFNENADVSGNTAKRRGRGGTIAAGAGGLGIVGVLLMLFLNGGDLSQLFSAGDQQGSSGQDTQIANCETGADANERDDCRLAAATLSIDQFWAEQVSGYREPQLIIVDGSAQTPCGTASNATGPFYCPSDETIYIDPSFWSLLSTQFGGNVGPLAQLYVLAHEYGHHIQQLTGVFDSYPRDGSGPTSNSVRAELQADCYAGAWVAHASEAVDADGVPFLQKPTEADLQNALAAAATVGDDNIQSQAGQVNEESWTHGSSEQRQRWFATGYQYGVGQCDTFSISGDDL